MNPARLTTFKTVYAEALKLAMEQYPEDYKFKECELPLVTQRMFSAIERGSYNKEGRAFKMTCKHLGIKHTYKAIRHYLLGA